MKWSQLIDDLKVGRAGGRKAPHKPLLLLMLLQRAASGERNVLPFSEFRSWFDPRVRRLGLETEARYPFFHLQSCLGGQGWVLHSAEGGRWSLERRPPQAWFNKQDPVGRLHGDLWMEASQGAGRAIELAEALIQSRQVDDSFREGLRTAYSQPSRR